MTISDAEYEKAKRWVEIFDDMAVHLADSLKHDGNTEDVINAVVSSTLGMRDKLKTTVQAYEENKIYEL